MVFHERLSEAIKETHQRIKERKRSFQNKRINRQDAQQNNRNCAEPGDHALQAVLAITPFEEKIYKKDDEKKNDYDKNEHLPVLLSIV
jgi:hypothetical protein